MDRCDYISDYQEQYECRKNWWEAINYNINDLLNERFNTPSSKVELETIKQQALNNLTPKELDTFRNYIIELSNESSRDDRLQLRELATWLYIHTNNNYTNIDNNINNQYNNIEVQGSSITFIPRSWSIELNPIWWFADWKYQLQNYNITPISTVDNIYNLELEFLLRKKQKVLWLKTHVNYPHKEKLEFKYEKYNRRLIIKHDWVFYDIPIISQKHRKWNHKNWETLNIKIWNIKMNLFFKAD